MPKTTTNGGYGKQVIGNKEYLYYAFPANAEGKRKRIYAQDKSELESKIAEYKESLESKLTVSLDTTFYDFIKLYLFDIKPYTANLDIRRYQTWVEYYIKDTNLGNMKCGAIRTEHIKDFFEQFRNKYSKNFIEKLYSFIEQLIDKLCKSSNKNKIVMPDLNDFEENKIPLNSKDVEIIIKECMRKNDNNYYYSSNGLIILTTALTGCSTVELCGLRWKDVASDLTTFTINSYRKRKKTGDKMTYIDVICDTPRTVYIPSVLKPILTDLRAKIDDINDLVFASHSNNMYDRSNVERTLSYILNNVGLLPSYNPQDLQYTYGVQLLNNGLNLGTVSYLLGHTSLNQTCKMFNDWVSNDLSQLNDINVNGIDNYLNINI